MDDRNALWFFGERTASFGKKVLCRRFYSTTSDHTTFPVLKKRHKNSLDESTITIASVDGKSSRLGGSLRTTIQTWCNSWSPESRLLHSRHQ
jgi:hypothetical protein